MSNLVLEGLALPDDLKKIVMQRLKVKADAENVDIRGVKLDNLTVNLLDTVVDYSDISFEYCMSNPPTIFVNGGDGEMKHTWTQSTEYTNEVVSQSMNQAEIAVGVSIESSFFDLFNVSTSLDLTYTTQSTETKRDSSTTSKQEQFEISITDDEVQGVFFLKRTASLKNATIQHQFETINMKFSGGVRIPDSWHPDLFPSPNNYKMSSKMSGEFSDIVISSIPAKGLKPHCYIDRAKQYLGDTQGVGFSKFNT